MYEIEEDPAPKPELPGVVDVAADADEVVDHVAADLVQHAFNCVRQFGDFHLALSDDRAFTPLYRRLMYDPRYRWLPWRRTHLWFVEGAVDADAASPSDVAGLIGEHADIPAEQFHAIPCGTGDAAQMYEDRIREVLAWREKGQDRLDCVLLALDAEGHAGGLFPGSPVLDESDRLFVTRADRGRELVSMTPAFMRAARLISIMVTGAESAGVVERIASGTDAPPVAHLEPIQGELKWYVDLPACAAS